MLSLHVQESASLTNLINSAVAMPLVSIVKWFSVSRHVQFVCGC